MKFIKKLLFSLALSSLLCTFICAGVSAADKSKVKGTVINAPVNVRQKPLSRSKLLKTLKVGTRLTIFSEQNNYYETQYKGKRAYVHKSFIQLDDYEEIEQQKTIPKKATPIKKDLVIAPLSKSDDTVIISLAGDCTLGSDHGTWNHSSSFVRYVRNRYDWPFSGVQDYFSSDDLTLVNLEGTLTNFDIPQEKKFRFRGPPEYSQILVNGSVEAVNIANNHTYDYGVKGMKDTLASLDDKKVVYSGNGVLSTFTSNNGYKIGMAGYQAWGGSLKSLKSDIKKLRENECDIVITSFHWGVERSYSPSNYQRNLAKQAIDFGSDLVVGHHPHVLQPVTEYKSRYILYSLGNFSFGGNRNPYDRNTVIVQMAFKFDDDGIKSITPNFVPCSMSTSKSGNDFRPVPVTGKDARRVYDKLGLN